MRASKLAVVLFLSVGLLAGCHGGELTRDHAKQLIAANQSFTAGTQVLSVPWNVAGMYEQIVKFDGVNSSHDNMAVQPSYQHAVRSARQGSGESVHDVFLSLASPLKPAIQNVTGISDGSAASEKLVDFQWNYATPPPQVLSPLLPTAPYQGRAVFKKYDDGWRVERLNWQPSGSS